MSQKQIFNKDYQLAKMAKKRRNRWQTRDYLVDEIDRVLTMLGDANWIMYQVLCDEPNMSRKSRVKLFRWLATSGYDVEKYRPEAKK